MTAPAEFACDAKSGWAGRRDGTRVTVYHRDARSGAIDTWTTRSLDDSTSTEAQFVVHDFDGDGSPELAIVWTYGAGAEDEFAAAPAFVTFSRGHIAPYAPASGLPFVPSDLDDDGRPSRTRSRDSARRSPRRRARAAARAGTSPTSGGSSASIRRSRSAAPKAEVT